MPPSCYLNAEAAAVRFGDLARRYADALQSAGVPVEYRTLSDPDSVTGPVVQLEAESPTNQT